MKISLKYSQLFLFVFLFLISCSPTQEQSSKTFSATDNNFKVSWEGNSNFLKFTNLEKKDFIKSSILVQNNLKKNTVEDSISLNNLKNSNKHFNDMDLRDPLTSIFEISCDSQKLVNIFLSNIQAKKIEISDRNGEILNIAGSIFQNTVIDTPKRSAVKSLSNTLLPMLPTITIYNVYSPKQDYSGSMTIDNKKIDVIIPGKIHLLNLDYCFITDSSRIDCSDVDTLALHYSKYKSVSTKLRLSSGADVELIGYYVIPTHDNLDHKTILDIDDDDINRVEFDYQYFTFKTQYFYSKNVKIYQDIIKSQRHFYNQEGIRDAQIDSAIYEDKQHIITSCFIPVKLWWNNYGHDKSKVIGSTITLFCLIWIINFLTFTKVLFTYKFEEILKRRKNIGVSSRKIKSDIVLSLFYTGYLFFGLKFELNRLNLESRLLALWIIIQYVLGIVSLAYIANLIISR